MKTFITDGTESNRVLTGTKREVFESLLEREQTPTELSDRLDVSVQTASRTLKELAEEGYVEEVPRDSQSTDEQRGYKPYRALEFARLYASLDGTVLDRMLALDPDKRIILSIWQIPQPEFHPVMTSYLFSPEERFRQARAIGVYGSVARGEAKPDSDVDVLILCDDEVDTEAIHHPTVNWGFQIGPFRVDRVISEEWLTVTDFDEGLAAGSQFLENVLDEVICLYDPDDLIRNVR